MKWCLLHNCCTQQLAMYAFVQRFILFWYILPRTLAVKSTKAFTQPSLTLAQPFVEREAIGKLCNQRTKKKSYSSDSPRVDIGRSLPYLGGRRRGREIIAAFGRSSRHSGGRCRVVELVAMLVRTSPSSGECRRVWEVIADVRGSLPCWAGRSRVREIVAEFGRSDLPQHSHGLLWDSRDLL